MENIETLLGEANNGDIVEVKLKGNYYLVKGSEDFSLRVSNIHTHQARGPIKSISGYYGGYKRRELCGDDAVYIDPFIMPLQETQWHEPRQAAGDLIEVPLSSIESWGIIQKVANESASDRGN